MSRRSRGTALRWLEALPPRRRTRIPRRAPPGGRQAPRGRRRACGSSSRRCPCLASLPNVGCPLSRRSRHIEHVAVEHRHCGRSVIDHQAQLRVDGAQFLLRADPACDVGYERDVLSRPSLRIGDRGNKIADPDRRSAFGYESIFDLKLRFFELIHCANLVLGRSPTQASAATVSHGLQEIRTSNSCQETGNFERGQGGDFDQRGPLKRRHVFALLPRFICKEGDDIEENEFIDADTDPPLDCGVLPRDRTALAPAVFDIQERYGVSDRKLLEEAKVYEPRVPRRIEEQAQTKENDLSDEV